MSGEQEPQVIHEEIALSPQDADANHPETIGMTPATEFAAGTSVDADGVESPHDVIMGYPRIEADEEGRIRDLTATPYDEQTIDEKKELRDFRDEVHDNHPGETFSTRTVLEAVKSEIAPDKAEQAMLAETIDIEYLIQFSCYNLHCFFRFLN